MVKVLAISLRSETSTFAPSGHSILYMYLYRYSSWNGNPSFSDFSQFGGWTQPAIKQYKGNVFVCGVSIDEDWYM